MAEFGYCDNCDAEFLVSEDEPFQRVCDACEAGFDHQYECLKDERLFEEDM